MSNMDKSLTRRECAILELLEQGYTGKEMAERLSLSQSTIQVHIGHLREKLCVPRNEPTYNFIRRQQIKDAYESLSDRVESLEKRVKTIEEREVRA